MPFFTKNGWFLVLNSQFLADGSGDSVLVDEEVHRVGSDKVLGHIPGTFIVAGLAPGVLYHIILLAVLVLGHTVDMHAVVVGQFPVVETLLTLLLCGNNLGGIHTQRVKLLGLLR